MKQGVPTWRQQVARLRNLQRKASHVVSRALGAGRRAEVLPGVVAKSLEGILDLLENLDARLRILEDKGKS